MADDKKSATRPYVVFVLEPLDSAQPEVETWTIVNGHVTASSAKAAMQAASPSDGREYAACPVRSWTTHRGEAFSGVRLV